MPKCTCRNLCLVTVALVLSTLGISLLLNIMARASELSHCEEAAKRQEERILEYFEAPTPARAINFFFPVDAIDCGQQPCTVQFLPLAKVPIINRP